MSALRYVSESTGNPRLLRMLLRISKLAIVVHTEGHSCFSACHFTLQYPTGTAQFDPGGCGSMRVFEVLLGHACKDLDRVNLLLRPGSVARRSWSRVDGHSLLVFRTFVMRQLAARCALSLGRKVFVSGIGLKLAGPAIGTLSGTARSFSWSRT